MRRRSKLSYLTFLVVWVSFLSGGFDFKGTHYIASYKKCESPDLENIHRLFCYFLIGIEQSGATMLHFYMHPFGETAMTGTAILMESHASIHTYPEHKSVFVDLFTCGESTDWKKFEEIMVEILQPKIIERKIIDRN